MQLIIAVAVVIPDSVTSNLATHVEFSFINTVWVITPILLRLVVIIDVYVPPINSSSLESGRAYGTKLSSGH